MNALGAGTAYAVPDSSFPFSNELGGLADLLDTTNSFSPMRDTKPVTLQEDGGYYSTLPPFPMTEYDGYCYNWMCEDGDTAGLLPSPEEQDSDLLSFHLPQSMSTTYIPSLPTPEGSMPATPTSTYHHQQDPELLDALSLIDGYSSSPDSSTFHHPTEILPQFDVHSPLPSPPSSNSSSYSPYNPNPTSFLLSSPALSTTDLNGYPLSVASDTSSSSMHTPSQSNPKNKSIVELLVEDTHIPEASTPSDVTHSPVEEVSSNSAAASGSKRKRSIVEQEDEFSEQRTSGKGKRRKLSKAAKNERKKEQNKQAALRYRQRKRGETESIEEKRERLEEQNANLKSEVNALTAKIDYLKEVWREIQAARDNSKQS